jgi:hypothetical protein
MRRLLITVIVLLGLLAAADRVGVLIAQRATADTIEHSQHLSERPDVDITGFPFLTQLASGEFKKIVVTSHGVQAGHGNRTLRLDAVAVTLRKVSVARDFGSATAKHVRARARIGYAAVTQLVGHPVSYGGAGRVRTRVRETVLGRHVGATVSARPELRHGSLAFGAPRVSVNGAKVPTGVTSVLAKVFGSAVSLAHLPYGLTVRSLTINRSGIVLRLRGRHITFSG